MPTQLLQLDTDTLVNPKAIVQITILNLTKLRQERRQHHETPEQREYMDGKYWEVSVYLRSDSNGYNPQRYTKRFMTQKEGQDWVKHKFGGSIVHVL